MAFDAREYRGRVLTPFKNQRLPELQAGLRELKNDNNTSVPISLDLVELYDMSAGGSDAVVAAQVASVADTFNKCMTNATFKKIGPTLVEIHKLLDARNAGFATAGFWDARLADRGARGKERLAEFVDLVAIEANVLGLITTARLVSFAKDVGVDAHVSPAEIEAAVRAAGVEIVAPVVRPNTNVPPAVLSELRKTSCASIVDAIFLEATPSSFTVVEGFAGSKGERLSLGTVAASRRVTEQRSSNDDQNDAVRKALGSLERLGGNHELEDVVLAYFIEIGRQAAQIEPALALALKRLTDTRLERRDAARILTLFSDGQSTAGFPEVHQKVADGVLKEARRLFDALCSAAGESMTDVRTNAQAALEGAERRLEELRAVAQVAVETGDLARASKALTEALTVCTDDESLAEMQAALPPAAPLNLVVTTGSDGRIVQVMWEPGFGTTADVRYVVLRNPLRPPQNAHDGVTVAKGLGETRFDDHSPELATLLHYGVAATRGGGFSPVVSLSVTVLPPVRDVLVRSELSSISLSWNPPAGARAVRVVQTAPDSRQTELVPHTQGGVTSRGLTTGATYTFVLTALYATAGGDLAAEPCRVTGTPRGEAKPVPFVNVRQVGATTGNYELEATWTTVPGFDVEIWHLPTSPHWTYGSRVAMTEIDGAATRLTGVGAGGGRRDGVRGAVRPGLRFYFAVTRDGEAGIIGQSNAVGICPLLTDVTAERFNDVVLLSWTWPGEEFDVEVMWQGRTRGERRMTHSQYLSEGGLRVQSVQGNTRFRLQTVPASGDEAWSSPEVAVDVPGAAPSVRYTVSWHKKPFRPPHAVTLSFASDENLTELPVMVTAQAGQVMPYAKDSGVVLTEESLDLSATGTAALTVPIRGLGPHFWVRAFPTTNEIRLIDPPSGDLRGC
jgi:hypothetical protein